MRQTLKQWALKHLTDNGLGETQAHEVFGRFVALDENDSMRERWCECAEGYPNELAVVLQIGLNFEAVKWIDENLPAAWFRVMFDGPAKAEAQIKEAQELTTDVFSGLKGIVDGAAAAADETT